MSYVYWFSASFCTVVAVAQNSVPEDGFCDIPIVWTELLILLHLYVYI